MTPTRHHHGHGHVKEKAEADTPPDDVQSVEQRYREALTEPMDAIIAEIEAGIEERDIFDLETRRARNPIHRFDPDDLVSSDFEFDTDTQTRQAFLEWLDAQQEAGVLSVISPDENEYVDDAYIQGMRNADGWLTEAGEDPPDMSIQEAFDMPVHKDRVEKLYTRNYKNLEGLTGAAGDAVREELSQGMVDGVGPEEMARRISGRYDDIGKKRARTLARTEVMNAHHEATIERYQQSGLERVDILTTNPCEICTRLEADAPYSVRQASGLLPAHPNCRCALRPVVNTPG